jgi:hypothetical protein
MQNENLRDHGSIAAWTDADNGARQRENLLSSRRAVVRCHLGDKFQGKGDEVTVPSSSCAAFMGTEINEIWISKNYCGKAALTSPLFTRKDAKISIFSGHEYLIL